MMSIKLSMTKLNQAGDTIVEVLIAIAVVSGVLGITYSIMNKNVATIQDNQERTEASKLVQGQLELLRRASEDVNSSITLDDNFCLSVDTVSGVIEKNGNILTNGLVKDSGSGTDGYNGDCIGTVGTDDRYFINIVDVYPGGSNARTNFRVMVRWHSLAGGDSQVVMSYRIKR